MGLSHCESKVSLRRLGKERKHIQRMDFGFCPNRPEIVVLVHWGFPTSLSRDHESGDRSVGSVWFVVYMSLAYR